jgi:hypothetical protein
MSGTRRDYRGGGGSNMKKFLICFALFAQSTGVNGQTSTSQDESCLRVTHIVSVCINEHGRNTWAFTGFGGQVAYLPDAQVRIDLRTIPYDPEWALNADEFGSIIADELVPTGRERLTTFGTQGSFQTWGHVRTVNYEIVTGDDECHQFVTYQYVGEGSLLLISSHYCSASRPTYSETKHYDLLGSIEIKHEH